MLLYYSWVKQFKDKLDFKNIDNILMAFPELNKKKDKDFWTDKRVFLDSGGFSIRNSWMELDVKDYAEFIKQYGSNFEVCANMDTSDTKETLENQKYLEEETGQFILPVFHRWELKEWNKQLMEDYCEKYDYVAIWGMASVKMSKPQKKYYLDFCFHTAMKHKTKLHWFGITSMHELKRYPFYSVDSTTWLSARRYNCTFKFSNGKLWAYGVHKMKKLWIAFAELTNEQKMQRSLNEWYKFEKYIDELHKVKGLNYWEK